MRFVAKSFLLIGVMFPTYLLGADYTCWVSKSWQVESGTWRGEPVGEFKFDSSNEEGAGISVDGRYYMGCSMQDPTGGQRKDLEAQCVLYDGIPRKGQEVPFIALSSTRYGQVLRLGAMVPDESLPYKSKMLFVNCDEIRNTTGK